MNITIVTGGQTGVDRAAMDAAAETGIAYQGYCPEGRKAEDGVIPDTYPLTEIPKGTYTDRTRKNVEISDMLLVFGEPDDGSQFAIEYADALNRPVIRISSSTKLIECYRALQELREAEHGFLTINVAGPRESVSPGIYEQGKRYFLALFELLLGDSERDL